MITLDQQLHASLALAQVASAYRHVTGMTPPSPEDAIEAAMREGDDALDARILRAYCTEIADFLTFRIAAGGDVDA